VISGRTALLFFPEHPRDLGIFNEPYPLRRKFTLTDHGEKPPVELTGQDVRGEFTHKHLEQPRNGVRIQVLIRSEQVNIPVCESVCTKIESSGGKHERQRTRVEAIFQPPDGRTAAAQPVDTLLLIRLLHFQILDAPENYGGQIGDLGDPE